MRGRRGFSAIEILVLLMLAAVTIPAFLTFFTASHRQAHFVDGLFEARCRAEEALDTMEWILQERGLRDLDTHILEELLDNGTDIDVEVAIDPVPQSPGLLRLKAVVPWSAPADPTGPKSFTLERLMLDPEIMVRGT